MSRYLVSIQKLDGEFPLSPLLTLYWDATVRATVGTGLNRMYGPPETIGKPGFYVEHSDWEVYARVNDQDEGRVLTRDQLEEVYTYMATIEILVDRAVWETIAKLKLDQTDYADHGEET